MCFQPKIRQAAPPPEPLEQLSSAPVSGVTKRKRKKGSSETSFLLPTDVQIPK